MWLYLHVLVALVAGGPKVSICMCAGGTGGPKEVNFLAAGASATMLGYTEWLDTRYRGIWHLKPQGTTSY